MTEVADSQSNLRFVQDKFREYYLENVGEIAPPSYIEKREFGFILFRREKLMIRHRGFEDSEGLRGFIKALAPSDVYYSSAYYERPGAETMKEKGWLGADLIFDVDCDHLHTSCKEEHDRWRCLNCGESRGGRAPTKCPKCGSERLDVDSWVCEKCLETAKQELLKLIGMLEDDLGVTDKEMTAVFSGHRGYHLHVESNTVKSMSSAERKEIVDYVTATGLNIGYYGLSKDRRSFGGPSLDDSGWGGRLARAVYTLLLKNPEELRAAGIAASVAKKIVDNRERMLDAWEKGKGWDLLSGIKKASLEKVLKKALTYAAASVDTVVTTDIHRLIRLPNTLHGKTGLRVIAMPVHQLVNFEPLRDSLVFTGGEMRVRVSDAPRIRIGDSFYGPFRNEVVKLPLPVAMFLICRNKASPS
jgi:DNA primase small subunit